MIREVRVATALEREIQPDGESVITIDAYRGCQLRCPYCFQYANSDWAHDIEIRTNIVETLRAEIETLPSGTEIYIGSLSDPYMELERSYRLTRALLEMLSESNLQVFVTTKAVNRLILRDVDVFESFRLKPKIMLGLSEIHEAARGSEHVNIEIANSLAARGFSVSVFITPILPYIMDVDAMIAAIAPPIRVYLDRLRIFDSAQVSRLSEFIARDYPSLADNYRRVLTGDEEYYAEVYRRYSDDARVVFLSSEWGL